MDEIKKLSPDEFSDIASKLPFNNILLAKDYYITLILYLIKDVDGIYFKGGTALQKIFLDYSRLSEDLDFTATKETKEIKKEIKTVLEKAKLFESIGSDKNVEGFTRLIVHYKGFSSEAGTVFIDLNKRARILSKPEKHNIKHFYKGSIPLFSVKTIAKEEMVAEKMAATIGRNKPRDHYDLYKIIEAKIPINLEMVEKKCKQSGVEFNIVKMFNKAQKLKRKWDEDMIPLIKESVSFQKIMTTLARHFKLKDEKERQRIKR